MISRLTSLAAAILASALLSNCAGNNGLNIVSKSSIGGASNSRGHSHASLFSGKESFPTAAPSSTLVSSASAKPKDRHNMPVYAFSDRNRVVRTTAYTCSEDDHLVYGSKNATGTHLRYSNRVRSAAADWSFYPVGTVFRIKGLPYLYVVDDYGSALTGTGTVDIYKPSKDIMNQWGRRNVELTIVQWGSFTRSAEILAKRTGFPHCRQMYANIIRQRPDLAKVAQR
jgi:3D (Asp-Asp-Asp) domain-containing protein